MKATQSIAPRLEYQSYLLRLWQEQVNGEQIWRASLEQVQTGQRHYFATLEHLVAFLYHLSTLS